MDNKYSFFKYQGTGNDFIIFSEFIELSKDQIQHLCDRKFGIGADGLILMKKSNNKDFDFEMMYYNADGSESFCGNGSRCSVMHANTLGWISDSCTFTSNDGIHQAKIVDQLVHLKMHDVSMILLQDEDFMLNTGSPHYIIFEENIDELDIVPIAQEIRYNDTFKEVGINVNFVEIKGTKLSVRTYERGVEDETLSCGTGVTAAALAHYLYADIKRKDCKTKINTLGGELSVSFTKTEKAFQNIYLIGPAEFVFSGKVEI